MLKWFHINLNCENREETDALVDLSFSAGWYYVPANTAQSPLGLWYSLSIVGLYSTGEPSYQSDTTLGVFTQKIIPTRVGIKRGTAG